MNFEDGTKIEVEREKVVDYLLNQTHPENGGKATFFERLGFRGADWENFALALKLVGTQGNLVGKTESPHGRKYVIVGKMGLPPGRTAMVQTIWIVDKGEQAPRLVKAYPAKARENE